MKNHLQTIPAIMCFTLLICSFATNAQNNALIRPKVDPSIDVDPKTDVLIGKAYATGVQIYNFVLDEKTKKYVLDGSKSTPDALLFDETGKQIGKHGKGPSWESTLDYSKVEGIPESIKKFPVTNTIAWLLLSTKQQSPGKGIYSNVTKIQRVETSGGVPPKDPNVLYYPDKVIKVPYTAVYYFYTAKK